MNTLQEEKPVNYKKAEFVLSSFIHHIYKLPDPILGKTTVQILSRGFNISHSYLCRIFKTKMNLNPSEFLFRVKMLRAFKLIRSENSHSLTIADISKIFGFKDVEWFITVFRRFWGVTPGRFRKSANTLAPGIIQKYQSGKQVKSETRFSDIIQYIHSLPDQILGTTTIQIMANKFKISTRYLIRLFNMVFTCTPGIYLQRVKMSRIFMLLECVFSNALTIAEISMLFGFEDIDYFTRLFKQYWGMTPGGFRKESKSFQSVISKEEKSFPRTVKRRNFLTKKNKESVYTRIIEYILKIDNRALGQLTVGRLAFKFNISRFQLYTFFCQETDYPFNPSEFLKMVKLLRAFKMLNSVDSTSLTIRDISSIFDFERADYFIREFKKFWGMTPGGVKKNRSLLHRESNRR